MCVTYRTHFLTVVTTYDYTFEPQPATIETASISCHSPTHASSGLPHVGTRAVARVAVGLTLEASRYCVRTWHREDTLSITNFNTASVVPQGANNVTKAKEKDVDMCAYKPHLMST